MPLGSQSVLGWVVRAARESDALDELLVATTVEEIDDMIADECERLGVEAVRGSVDDVLSRFTGAISGRGADAVARFTADCPLLDPAIIDATVSAWRAAPWLDYVSTALPRCLPRGMDAEVVRAETLRALDRTAGRGYHRTHVTSGIYTDPARYRMLGLTLYPDASDLRVTLDTADDWRLVTAIVDEFGDRPADLADVVDWLRGNPDAVALNSHVAQKPLEVG